MASCTTPGPFRGITPQLYTPGVFVKLMRALIAAAVAVAAAAAFQLAASSAGATGGTTDGTDCIGCWGSQIDQN